MADTPRSGSGTVLAPEVMPAVATMGGMQPISKWVGQPSSGGMGGAMEGAKDKNYDPSIKPTPWTEVGSSGLAQYGGFVRDEFLHQLQGDRGLKIYREMYDNDAVIGALVFAIQMLIRKVEWRVEPPEAATVEEIVEERLAEKQRLKEEQQMKSMMAMQPPVAPGVESGAQDGSVPQNGQNPQSPPASPPAFASPLPTRPVPPIHKPLRGREPMGKKPVTKATTGSAFGAIAANPPMGIDPESGEPLEYALDESPEIDENERKGMELAVLIETALFDMGTSWHDILSEIVTMIVFGFSFFEIIYKKRNGSNLDDPDQSSHFDDGKIGWAKWGGRAQETVFRWEFDDNGQLLGMWQMAPPKFKMVYIPINKALLFRTTTYKGNPQGRSLLRSAYRSWAILRRIQEFEAIGVERDLGGLPIVYVPYQMMTASATPEERQTLAEIKQMVRNVRRNEQEGIVFPMAFDTGGSNKELYKFELLSSPAKRQFDVDKIIRRYEQRIAMVVLADFILLGHDSVGARSLGDTKTELFTSAIEAILSAIADVINMNAIPRLLELNGEDPALSPKLTFGKLGAVSLTEVANMITSMSTAGFDLSTDAQMEDSLRQKAGLPTVSSTSGDL